MTAGGIVAILFGLVVVAAVVVVGVGAFALSSQTEVTSEPGVVVPAPPLDGSEGVVFDLHESDGVEFLGITFRAWNYTVDVQMVVPDECIQRDGSNNEVLVDDGDCADLPAQGELVGSGFTESQRRLAFVRMDISQDCYEALTIGDRWPSSLPECSAEDS